MFIWIYSSLFPPFLSSVIYSLQYCILFLRRRKEREELLNSSYKFPPPPPPPSTYFRLSAVYIYIFLIFLNLRFFCNILIPISLRLFVSFLHPPPPVFNITFPACSFISARNATVSFVTSVYQSVLPHASSDSRRTDFEDVSCLYF
jgi:hypothetical protein